jgi:FkbM family methyltransferase
LCEFIFYGFEKKETYFVLSFLDEGDRFIDIGANIGYFTLLAAEKLGPKGKVYAFEPDIETYQNLIKNVELNDFSKYVECYNKGLSDCKESLQFTKYKEGHDAWNSLSKPINLDFVDKIEEIEVYPLDNVMSVEDFKLVKLIKIDVEGWEKFVILGMQSLLKKHKPTLIIEFSDENLFKTGYTSFDLFNLICSLGYDAFEIVEDGLLKTTFKGYYDYVNLVFKPKYAENYNLNL